MRNLLISLTFIFTLIIFNSTDAFSQSRGGGSMVDIFGLVFSTAGTEGTNGWGNGDSPTAIHSRIEVQISEEEGSETIRTRYFLYLPDSGNNFGSNNNTGGIELPVDIDAELNGTYYVKAWMNGVFLGGKYKDDF